MLADVIIGDAGLILDALLREVKDRLKGQQPAVSDVEGLAGIQEEHSIHRQRGDKTHLANPEIR